MAGVDISNGTWSAYPAILKDADWQKKKGKIGKLVKTGLGAELAKAEALSKKIDIGTLDPSSSPSKTRDEVRRKVEAAKTYYKANVLPLQAQMKKISAKATEAEGKLKKMPGGGDAAKAAAAIAKEADSYAVTLKSLDLEKAIQKATDDVAKKMALAENLLKASIAKMAAGMKTFLSAPSYDSWGDNIKQQGRSVSNSVAQLPEYRKEFWSDWEKFKGFDEGTLGLARDDPKLEAKMVALVKKAGTQLKEIAAYKP